MIRAPEVFAPAVRGAVLIPIDFNMTQFCVLFISVSASFSSYSTSALLRCRLFWLSILVRMRSLVSIAAYAAAAALYFALVGLETQLRRRGVGGAWNKPRPKNGLDLAAASRARAAAGAALVEEVEVCVVARALGAARSEQRVCAVARAAHVLEARDLETRVLARKKAWAVRVEW